MPSAPRDAGAGGAAGADVLGATGSFRRCTDGAAGAWTRGLGRGATGPAGVTRTPGAGGRAAAGPVRRLGIRCTTGTTGTSATGDAAAVVGAAVGRAVAPGPAGGAETPGPPAEPEPVPDEPEDPEDLEDLEESDTADEPAPAPEAVRPKAAAAPDGPAAAAALRPEGPGEPGDPAPIGIRCAAGPPAVPCEREAKAGPPAAAGARPAAGPAPAPPVLAEPTGAPGVPGCPEGVIIRSGATGIRCTPGTGADAVGSGPASGKGIAGRSSPAPGVRRAEAVRTPLSRDALDSASRTAGGRTPMSDGFCQVGRRPPNPASATPPGPAPESVIRWIAGSPVQAAATTGRGAWTAGAGAGTEGATNSPPAAVPDAPPPVAAAAAPAFSLSPRPRSRSRNPTAQPSAAAARVTRDAISPA